MKSLVLNKIKDCTIQTLKTMYGYCGVMDSDNVAILNSGLGSDNYIITIEDKQESDGKE